MGPIGSHETSVSNYITPRNNPEDGRIRTKKKRFCKYDEINDFTWFVQQPKLVTEID
jgi:hypothetical protein